MRETEPLQNLDAQEGKAEGRSRGYLLIGF